MLVSHKGKVMKNKATDSWWEGSLNIFFVFLYKKKITFTLVILCIHLKRFKPIYIYIYIYNKNCKPKK